MKSLAIWLTGAMLCAVSLHAEIRELLRLDFGEMGTEDASHVVVDSGHAEFPKALDLRSVRGEDGKVKRGNYSVPMKCDVGATVLTIDYWWKPVDGNTSRYGWLLNSADKKKLITLVQESGKIRIQDGGTWRDIDKITLGQWHCIRYQIHLPQHTFDVFVDDLQKPVFVGAHFREECAAPPARLWTLGWHASESSTLFGPVAVTQETSDTWPPSFAAEPPLFLHTAPILNSLVGWEGFLPENLTEDDRKNLRAPVVYPIPFDGSTKEGTTISLFVAKGTLCVLFHLDGDPNAPRRAPKVTQKDGRVWMDDCFEFFLRPCRADGTIDQSTPYYHFAGNLAGALYDAKCTPNGLRDATWDAGATLKIRRLPQAWEALLAIPVAAFGVPLAHDADTLWGFHAGRENCVTKEVSSRMRLSQFHDVEHFGWLVLPARESKLPFSKRERLLVQRICRILD
ncbi:MAG: hypothetical protein IJJ26_09470, partial [Victivallales bacterium]|nr:hypothetical protein [Victivallales bacterium]